MLPTGIAITPDGTRAYVPEANSRHVSVIDTNPASPTFNTETALILLTSVAPILVAITPNVARGYVTNIGSNDVSVIDTNPAE
jgi:DNA-binding beta-propeller fold protein YncE